MDLSVYYPNKDEKPLDHVPANGGLCRIFRRIGCIGDSLSSGEFQIRKEDETFSYYDMFEYSWGQHIARMTGSTVLNFSRGGMTAKEYCESFGEINRFWSPEKACQAYIIALGCNDKRWPEEVGSIEDIDFADYHNNKPTFAGYYGTIVQRLKEIQPRAKFFFVTLPRDRAGVGENGENLVAKQINRNIRQIADRFENAYLIDLETYGPVYDDTFREHFFLEGHMNPAGYVFTADMIAAYIDYIIRNNMRDFDEIGFIGTQITNYKAKE